MSGGSLPAASAGAAPEDVFVGYVYWTVRLFLAAAFLIMVHLFFLKKQAHTHKKKILQFFTLPLLSLFPCPLLHMHAHTLTHPQSPYPLTHPPPIPQTSSLLVLCVTVAH